MLKRIILAVVVLSYVSLVAKAQYAVQGRVLDGENNLPLPGANVFIANTTHGTATNNEGAFVIDRLQAVHYQLVVSFVGYGTQVFDILPGEPKTYKVILKPDPKTLGEVVIEGHKRSRSEWYERFKIFKERFIGLSEDHRLCEFENPNVLQFEVEDGILKATVDSTLVLVNKALGYRVKILLEKYEFNMLTLQIHYEGQIVYELLKPEDDKQAVTWATNRLKAYHGSEMHFLRSLYKRNLNDEGFYFNIVAKDNTGVRRGIADTTLHPRSPIFNNKKIRMPTITKYARLYDSLSYVQNPDEPTLKFDGELEVKYIMEAESDDYRHNRGLYYNKTPQKSVIILRSPCVVQPHGDVYPQDAIETRDYWSWELMAESLPLDYDPTLDQAIVSASR